MDDAFADLEFPDGGLDLSGAFGQQRPGTTPVGTNVMTFEPTTDRARGGTRPGLKKYLTGAIPAGTLGVVGLIQHLNVIVDPTTEATLDEFDDDAPDAIRDPSSTGNPSTWGQTTLTVDPITGVPRGTRSPGHSRYAGDPDGGLERLIRNGGSGRQPHKNRHKRTYDLTVTASNQTKTVGSTFTFAGNEFTTSALQAGDSVSSCTFASEGSAAAAAAGTYPITISGAAGVNLSRYHIAYAPGTMTVADITFIQGAHDFAFSSLTLPVAFPGSVTAGRLLVALVRLQISSADHSPTPKPVTVTDSRGNTYVQAGTYFGHDFTGSGFGSSQLSIWYAVANSSGANTVTVSQSVSAAYDLFMDVVEFSGLSASSPSDQTGGHFDAGPTTARTTGSIAVSGARGLIVGTVNVALTAVDSGVVMPAYEPGIGTFAYRIGTTGAVSGTGFNSSNIVGYGASFKP